MGKKKSDYSKLFDSLETYSGLSEVYTLDEYLEALSKAIEYIMGVPFEYMTPEGYSKLDSMIEQYLEEKKEQVKENMVSYFTEYLRQRGRYRSSYIRTLEFLIDRPEYIEKYREAPMKTYREIADILGYSWRTVRDAFSYIRQAGLLE